MTESIIVYQMGNSLYHLVVPDERLHDAFKGDIAEWSDRIIADSNKIGEMRGDPIKEVQNILREQKDGVNISSLENRINKVLQK